MSNKVYDILKKVALIILPALATLWLTLGKIWGLPYTTEIGATITAVAVFLGACLELVDLLGGTTDANDENPGGKGVESASVPYLEFLHTQLVAQEPAHLGNKIEGGPLEGFVEIEYLALFHRGRGINAQRDCSLRAGHRLWHNRCRSR